MNHLQYVFHLLNGHFLKDWVANYQQCALLLEIGLCNKKPDTNDIGKHIYFDYFPIEKIDTLPDMRPLSSSNWHLYRWSLCQKESVPFIYFLNLDLTSLVAVMGVCVEDLLIVSVGVLPLVLMEYYMWSSDALRIGFLSSKNYCPKVVR